VLKATRKLQKAYDGLLNETGVNAKLAEIIKHNYKQLPIVTATTNYIACAWSL